MNPMRIGSANLTDRFPKHNGLTSVGGVMRPTTRAVNQPHVDATSWHNPQLPSQMMSAAIVRSRVTSLLKKANGQ